MKWKVEGAWKDSGDDAEMIIDAPTDQSALQIAARSGLLVASVSAYMEPRTPPPSPPAAAPEQTLRISRLGVAALVLGSVACLWAWVPIIGTFTLPLSIVGLGLGVAGLAVAMATKRYGLGFPVAGSVVCGLAVTLVLITTVLPMSEAMVAELRPGTPEIKVSAPPARVPRTVQPQWTPPRAPDPVHVAHDGTITVGDFEFTLEGVWRFRVPKYNPLLVLRLGKEGESIHPPATEQDTRDALTVDVAVRNISSTRRRDFSIWSWPATESMRDEHGNAYTGERTRTSEHERTLNPGDGVRVRFQFEPPIDAASKLTLTLPLRAVDSKGDVAFVIARTSISNTEPSDFGRALPAQSPPAAVTDPYPYITDPDPFYKERERDIQRTSRMAERDRAPEFIARMEASERAWKTSQMTTSSLVNDFANGMLTGAINAVPNMMATIGTLSYCAKEQVKKYLGMGPGLIDGELQAVRQTLEGMLQLPDSTAGKIGTALGTLLFWMVAIYWSWQLIVRGVHKRFRLASADGSTGAQPQDAGGARK